ncbi:MAG: DUF1697 domain-containing protein [bacterium]|nr:DUF1697 domain-containing protein [bacterium]
MTRHVAFLRGMNVGGHRIKNPALCSHFEALGFANVSAFMASGNVIFDAPDEPSVLARRIEESLACSLGYAVPTFLRAADEIRAIAQREPFAQQVREESVGRIQVAMLSNRPTSPARQAVSGLATEQDRLTIHGSELFWLPLGYMLESELDLAAIEAVLGPMTFRSKRTVERIVAKFFND